MSWLANSANSEGFSSEGTRAFTLVEILVVIGITAVLFFLLLGPLVNSFRLTQRAQMLAAAQDAGRRTLEVMTRELGSAAYIFDNTSHPFNAGSQIAGAAVQYDEFTNFLDIDVPVNPDTTANPGYNPAQPTVPAHAYNAKLDFVLPRHNAAGGLTDPTTGEPITLNNGAAAPTGLTFPLAPSTSMVRYWVGRRDPTAPYSTHGEGSLLAKTGNNTYFLYRAQFQPYTMTTTGGTTKTTVNSDLFTTRTDASGKTLPEFDDPDFFRVVTDSDINWLDAQHRTYGATGETVNHNNRVQKWMQIAKPVISSPYTDLILLPHNRDNSIDYNTIASLPNDAGSGAVTDPITGNTYPVVNTSVTFRFGSVSADASAAGSSDYASAGYGSGAASNNGLPFVPTVYTATERSWAFPYHISLYQYSNSTQPLYDTQVATTADATYMYQAGDLIEMYNNAPSPEVPVYDVTSGAALPPGANEATKYVPMVVTPDSAKINFDTPALPTPANPYNRFWQVSVTNVTAANGLLDLSNQTNFQNSPLPNVPLDNSPPPAPVAPQVANARIVPGSVRIYGPDAYPGPNNGLATLYTEVFPGNATTPQDNQYAVDYAHNAIQMYVSDLAAFGSQYVKIAFDYQANLAPAAPGGAFDPATPISPSNPASPYQVKVDYQTRDLLDINLGVRVYDPNNVGPADVVTVHNQVRIGNSNR